ncbi:MAG: hypothetical protein K0S32_475 [Bacteroidetes bacterium]|jgi:hypothetical protein|nr:hypothetical protein [Bacteroidota bacterium]
MKKTYFIAFSLFVFLLSCGQKNPDLPTKRPDDLVIDYHVDGGMMDYSVQIDVSADSCHFRKREDGKVVEKRFKLSIAERDSLYTLLQKNSFNKIKYNTEKGTVYDRGGVSVTIGWDKNKIIVSDAQSNFVQEKWYEQWRAVTEGIDGMISRKAGVKN